MSHTRKLHNHIKEGFRRIKDFTCLPWVWVCGVFDKDVDYQEPVNNQFGGYMSAHVEVEDHHNICDVVRCCCRTPIACVCFAATCSLGGSSCVILGVLGALGTVGTAFADVCCVPKIIAPSLSVVPSYNTAVIPSEHANLKITDESAGSTPILSPVATRK